MAQPLDRDTWSSSSVLIVSYSAVCKDIIMIVDYRKVPNIMFCIFKLMVYLQEHSEELPEVSLSAAEIEKAVMRNGGEDQLRASEEIK